MKHWRDEVSALEATARLFETDLLPDDALNVAHENSLLRLPRAQSNLAKALRDLERCEAQTPKGQLHGE